MFQSRDKDVHSRELMQKYSWKSLLHTLELGEIE